MKSSPAFLDMTRRAMLSVLATLPALPTLPAVATAQTATTDPLPSWNDTASKKAIMAFVERVTKQGSSEFVPQTDRIATFDNDGTLWAEQPLYSQLLFALDRVKVLAPQTSRLEEPGAICFVAKGRCSGCTGRW